MVCWTARIHTLTARHLLLSPGSRINKRKEIKTIVIEEPEMGLHPRAIVAVMLSILD